MSFGLHLTAVLLLQVGVIDLDKMISILLKPQDLSDPSMYEQYWWALTQTVKMIQLGATLGSDSERYHQSELLVEMFHKFQEVTS